MDQKVDAVNFVLIPDKFKGSLTAAEVMNAMEQGIRDVLPEAGVTGFLASDGGEGFLDSVRLYTPAREYPVQTVDPLGRSIMAPIAWDHASSTAYVELARASGLELLDQEERNPLLTSTLGTGMQIRSALDLGAETVFVGLGGSATNDGGCGIAHALGWRFLDTEGEPLDPIGLNLTSVTGILPPESHPEVRIIAINDVDNPLFGRRGAARVYAAQKGADERAIDHLDEGLRQLDLVVSETLGYSHAEAPGSGAAGGAAYGLKSFMQAGFISGTEFILDMSGVKDFLQAHPCDCIFTGEGRLDKQSAQGKLISGVLKLGQHRGIPVTAFCGMLEMDDSTLSSLPFHAICEIRDPDKTLSQNMKEAASLLRSRVSGVVAQLI